MVRQLPRKPRHFFDLFEEFGSSSIARLPIHQNGGLEIHYIARGHLHWEIEGRPFVVPPRSVFFTFPWERHGSSLDFEPGHSFYYAVFRLDHRERSATSDVRLVPGFQLAAEAQQQIFRRLISTRNRCFPANAELAWIMPRLVQELSQPDLMARTNVVALSHAALCELAKTVHHSSKPAHKKSSSEKRVLDFVQELRTQCAKSWTLNSMAAACRLKRTRFEILTKELTGDAPTLLLKRLRIRMAQQSLKNTRKAITEIAFDCGFESSQYFSRVFQELIATTPTEYRNHQGNLAEYDEQFLGALRRLQKQYERLQPAS